MTLTLHLQNESMLPAPAQATLQSWCALALHEAGRDHATELTVRIVAADEMQALNRRYRNRDTSTNVLAFTADLPDLLQLPLLGDIVICAPVVEQEAEQQGKPSSAHWAHMLIHGTLHLLGYDHQASDEAHTMEALETQLILALGFAAPYAQHLLSPPSIANRETPKTP